MQRSILEILDRQGNKIMAENSETPTIQEEPITLEFSPDKLEKIPLLPRSAWHSQLTYLKTLLKAKQTLDQKYSVEKFN
jgi:hypothetical protein